MIYFKNVSKKYDDKTIFKDFNLEIAENEITCILGESGVGKTTLLNMLSKLTSYDGEISFDGTLAYIFQEPRLIPNLTVLKNLRFANPNATDDEIKEILSQLEILDKLEAYPKTLSGGEAQRVSIARAFLKDANLILMDEPFSSLDLSIKYKLISYFVCLWKEKKKTVLLVTHDIDEALLLAKTILILKDGKIHKSFSLNYSYPRGYQRKENLKEEIIKEFIED